MDASNSLLLVMACMLSSCVPPAAMSVPAQTYRAPLPAPAKPVLKEPPLSKEEEDRRKKIDEAFANLQREIEAAQKRLKEK